MIKLHQGGVYLVNGDTIMPEKTDPHFGIREFTGRSFSREEARRETITYSILKAHNQGTSMEHPRLRFDCLASHDLTFVGVIETAKASGLENFPLPYVLTNCHNSLCAVGGTLNEDDHRYGLSAAQKYGGVFVPPHQAVIHSYMREVYAQCGSMILGSDSHTRYGSLGTMGIGEGGGELVKQLLEKTYDIDYPEVICVYLRGKARPGVGPQDIALAIIGAVFEKGYVKNKVMEFVGEGIENLSADFRHGIDVMTTETACLSSIWQTDGVTKEYYDCHDRPEDYKKLKPGLAAWYDGLIEVDLSKIKPMIALPFHPSNVFAIDEFNSNAEDILHSVEEEANKIIKTRFRFSLIDKIHKSRVKADQGIIAGCAGGTYENIMAAATTLKQGRLGNDVFSLSVYPASQPVMIDLIRKGAWGDLAQAGVSLRSSFCGPCFGAGDVPASGQLSIRHTTRNFPNREGSKPGEGQMAAVALMDARSIAATALNDGALTPATDLDLDYDHPRFSFDSGVYQTRVYNGFRKGNSDVELQYGPNITGWPEMGALEENLLLGIASVIADPVTTTDELIPSGDTSTYRSNPIAMARFTLSRKDPAYVGRAEEFQALERKRRAGEALPREVQSLLETLSSSGGPAVTAQNTGIGSVIYAVKPGDGSAREQAASCQRVLGGWANIAREYATKRYRSNLINWGMLPLIMDGEADFQSGDYIFIPGIGSAIKEERESIKAVLIRADKSSPLTFTIGELTGEERRILLAGCLINFYRREIIPV
ncbi:aconitase family protein [Treponema primitia ZAS-2]|uniref:Aconitase family protein n=1 Tax=Treponema primitia (strain ATCC BAA-887 / DSM 12427 / ZAS-2) TaxID=545694 RepID=F5YK99_TREPZ|nr:hydratase [Treponema primitia]AEF84129.1 aconitase family protein [Treponema primitia ZAS-2]